MSVQPYTPMGRFTIRWHEEFGYRVSVPNLQEATVVPASEYDALCDLIREAVPPGPKRLAALDQVHGSLGEWERDWLRRIFDGDSSAELLAEDTAVALATTQRGEETR